MDVNQRSTRPRLLTTAGVLMAAALLTTWAASAQAPQSLPGIIIAAPPPSMPPQPGPPMVGPNPIIPTMPPPQAAPQPPPATAAPKPRPKPRVAARPKEDGETADGAGSVKGAANTRIALLVNGDPITAYEIEQRARLMALGSDIQSRAQEAMKRLATSEAVNARWKQIVQDTIKQYQGSKTREQIIAIIQEKQKAYSVGLQKQAVEGARAAVLPGLREKAKQELIEEQIKLQDAKRNGAMPENSMVDDLVKDIAQRNKMNLQQFAQHFGGMGIDISTLKSRFRTQLAWTDTVRKQYGHLAMPGNREIDVRIKDASGEDQLELQLHRIVIPVPPKLDQRSMAQKLSEAEQLQRQFSTCRGTGALAAKVQGARFENMGARRLSTFSEPSRSMLLSAQDDTMIPPTMTSTGIELLAVCGRRVIKAVDERRNEEAAKLRQDNFERLARAHLRRLMDNAVIENR